MEYLKIKNWDKWQTYRSDRGQPPWIKIHRRLMRDPEWVSLSDAERGQLVGMWLLAADRDGVIPASAALIQKLSFMESEPNISKFIDLGFICQNGVNVASERRQVDQPKAEENREEKKRIEKNKKKKFIPPEINEVIKYFIENGYSEESATMAFKYYDEGNWKDSTGKQVLNWKQKMRGVWFKPENKMSTYKPKKPIQAGDMSIYE